MAVVCTATSIPGPWIFSRTFASRSCAMRMRLTGLPEGSTSAICALTIAPEKSFATRRPTMPALRMFSRTLAIASGVGSNSAGTTLPASMPSSTISV